MNNKAILVIALAALVLASLSFLLNARNPVMAQVKMKPYPIPQPANRIIWDYDSGWFSIPELTDVTLTHDLGGNPDDYFVYLTGKSHSAITPGVHHIKYGSTFYWKNLNSDTITFYRISSANPWDEARVRILKNQ